MVPFGRPHLSVQSFVQSQESKQFMLLRTFWSSDEMAWAFALEAHAFRQGSSHMSTDVLTFNIKRNFRTIKELVEYMRLKNWGG